MPDWYLSKNNPKSPLHGKYVHKTSEPACYHGFILWTLPLHQIESTPRRADCYRALAIGSESVSFTEHSAHGEVFSCRSLYISEWKIYASLGPVLRCPWERKLPHLNLEVTPISCLAAACCIGELKVQSFTPSGVVAANKTWLPLHFKAGCNFAVDMIWQSF